MKNPIFNRGKPGSITGPKPQAMSLIEYYSRTDRAIGESLRDQWDRIFRQCKLAPNTKADMKSRFLSKEDEQHLSAVFELFLYEFLHYLGCRVRSNAKLSGRPDYKVVTPSGSNFYLEATCNMGDLVQSTADHWKNAVTDAIRSIESDLYRLCVEYDGTPSSKPNAKRFKQEVKGWLRRLDHADLLKVYKQDYSALPVERFDVCGLKISLRPIPVDPPKSSKEHGMISIGPVEGAFRVRTGEFLWKKLKDKQKQIRGARLPVAIAVNELCDSLDDDEILQALFGPLHTHVAIRNGMPAESWDSRGPKGIWMHHGKPTNRSMSAVLFFNKIDVFMRPTRKPLVVINPFIAKNKFPLGLQLLDYYTVSPDGLSLLPISKVESRRDRRWLQDWPF